MRTVGRVVGWGLLVSLIIISFIASMPYLSYFQRGLRNGDLQTIESENRSIVYPLRIEPTEFVLSRPQRQIRIISNAKMEYSSADPVYAFSVQALDDESNIVLERAIYLRSTIRYIRGSDKRLLPSAFVRPQTHTIPSTGDSTIIEFRRPITVLRLSEAQLGRGVQGILARVQEQRPVSERQIEVGWQRLAPAEQDEIAAGSPLGHSLLTEAERRKLLVSRWNPVGPSGVEGRDYIQVMLYERTGAKLAPARRSE